MSLGRNALLLLTFILALILVINGTKRIMSLHGNSQKVVEAEQKLEKLKRENERLKQELSYKQTDRFAEGEIRNKLGLARPGEDVFVVPREESSQQSAVSSQQNKSSNWQKWRDLFLGKS